MRHSVARWIAGDLVTTMYTEDELLPISALQHLEFCPRRCGLIHVDGLWSENAQTAEGRVMHRKVHDAPSETAGGVRIVRGLRLRSLELGLYGVADVVEFHPVPNESTAGASLEGLPGRWRPFPVEYKRGKRKSETSYFVQLCAQALCIEEMLDLPVPAGALYHGKSRRRQRIEFDADLRAQTAERAGQLHQLIDTQLVPPPEKGPKCKFCSLKEQCLPDLPAGRSAKKYLMRMVSEMIDTLQ